MAIAKYITGTIIGPYTIIDRLPKDKLLCKCNECGSVVEVFIANASRNRMCKHCRTRFNTKPKEDLTGMRFGRLVVQRFVVKDSGKIAWECLCDCGNSTVVSTCHLKSGHTKSCGCYMMEQITKANSIDMSGRKFGRLTAIRKADGYKIPGGQSMSTYLCKCDCGAEVTVLASNLVNGNTQSCGCIGNSVGEYQIQKLLLASGVNFTKQHSFPDLRSTSKGGLLRFDFALWNPDGSLNCLIEFNGEQHYYQEKKYKYFGRLQREETDELKREYCLSNNLKLFEIRFDDDIPARVNDIISTTHN